MFNLQKVNKFTLHDVESQYCSEPPVLFIIIYNFYCFFMFDYWNVVETMCFCFYKLIRHKSMIIKDHLLGQCFFVTTLSFTQVR